MDLRPDTPIKRAIHPFDQELALDKLRKHPTIPPGAVDEEIEAASDRLKPVDEGHLWPRVFCAFKGCNWTSDVGDEECYTGTWRKATHKIWSLFFPTCSAETIPLPCLASTMKPLPSSAAAKLLLLAVPLTVAP